MKKSYILLPFISILFYSTLNGQTFYRERFGSGSSMPSGWTATGNWSVANANSSTPAPLSGNSNIAGLDCGGSGTLSRITVSGISTVGKSNIILSYGIKRSLLFVPSITTEWSSNGSTWNAISISDAGLIVGGLAAWHVVSAALPVAAEGQSNLRLRWSFTTINMVSCAILPPGFRIDDVTLGQNSVLPVTFSNVRAYKTGSGIKIDWSNLTESDIVNYEVERSSDGQNFTSLAQVAPTKTNGERSDYNFTDASPNNGVHFYRIVSLEINGKKMYTAIIRVDANNSNGGVTIYPNPVNGRQFSLQAIDIPKGLYNLTLYSTKGQQVHNQLLLLSGSNSTEVIQLPSLQPGLYNMQLNNGAVRFTKSFVIQ